MSMEKHGGVMTAEKNSRVVHQSSLEVLLAQLPVSKQEEWGKRNDEFTLAKYFCKCLHVIFYMP
jgi:hypothetical protein